MNVVVLDVRHKSMKNFNYLVADTNGGRAAIVDPAWEIDKIDRAIADPDHIDLAKQVSEKYDCPIWMSHAEIAASQFHAARLVGIDAHPWTVGELLIEPIHTPGHTPGSTCYLIGDNLFTGDVLFAEGCGICPDLNAAHAMFASLERLKTRLALHTRIFPGHSYGQPPGRLMSQVRRENIYLQFSNKESFAAFRLRRGQDRARLFNFH